jgi:hypothetical protein
VAAATRESQRTTDAESSCFALSPDTSSSLPACALRDAFPSRVPSLVARLAASAELNRGGGSSSARRRQDSEDHALTHRPLTMRLECAGLQRRRCGCLHHAMCRRALLRARLAAARNSSPRSSDGEAAGELHREERRLQDSETQREKIRSRIRSACCIGALGAIGRVRASGPEQSPQPEKSHNRSNADAMQVHSCDGWKRMIQEEQKTFSRDMVSR